MELTHKQVRFAFEYAKDGHGTNAAIRAGYAERGADVTASRLLDDPRIQERVERQKLAYATAAATSAAEIILELKELYLADRSKIVKLICDPCLNCYSAEAVNMLKAAGMGHTADAPNPECKLCRGRGVERVWLAPTDSLSPIERKCILGYEQKKDGIVNVKTLNPMEPLMKLAQMCGFITDKKEISGPGGGPIQMVANEKPLHLWTREEISAERARRQLAASVLGVLEGVSEKREPLTIDAKQLTD